MVGSNGDKLKRISPIRILTDTMKYEPDIKD